MGWDEIRVCGRTVLGLEAWEARRKFEEALKAFTEVRSVGRQAEEKLESLRDQREREIDDVLDDDDRRAEEPSPSSSA